MLSNTNCDNIENIGMNVNEINIASVNDAIDENGRQSGNIRIDQNNLLFLNNKKVRKYLISDYFQKRINPINNNSKDETNQEEQTNQQNHNNVIEVNGAQRSKEIIQSIKSKSYIQQHILKTPRPNDTWGSSIDTPNLSSIRLYYQNINGLMMGSKNNRWQQHIENMFDIGCNISGLAESNTNWNNTDSTNQIKIISSAKYKNISSCMSENRYQPNNVVSYLPGGVIQTCTNHWTGRILRTIKDSRKLGRWTGHQYRLKEQKTLTVITAYRTCNQSNANIKLESRTDFNQQVIMLTEDGIDKPNPRKMFVEDLIKEIKSIEQSPDNYIVLMIDANEDICDKEQGITKLLSQTTLVDAFLEHTKGECNIATYSRGSKRIDYIFTSENLVEHIERVGYTAFYSMNTSDHRGAFMDLKQSLIDNKVELSLPAIRNIGTKSKGNDIFNYKKEIDKQFKHHKIYERSKKIHLESLDEQISKTDIENHLNVLDEQITEIVKAAESKNCKKIHATEWSIEVHVVSLMCQYWIKQYKGLKNGLLVTQQLQTIWQKLPVNKKVEINSMIHDLTNEKLMKVSKERMKYYITYKRELLRYDKVLRKEGLQHLQEIRKQEGDNDQAVIIEKIYRKEMSKRDWLTVKNKFNPAIRSGISNVEIPDKDANGNPTNDPDKAITWKRITDPKEIEDKLIERNIRHFGQAEGTFFTNPKIKQDLHYEGVSFSVDRLLAGEYKTTEDIQITNGAQQLLNKLGDNRKLPKIHDGITFKEFVQGLRTWSEGTSTSPSGRHLGHYKSLLVSDFSDEYNEYYEDPKENILQVYYEVASAALNCRISLKRWQQSITAMIEKIPGCPKVNKLRVIHLYEADYNLLLKIIWARRLVWHVHDGDRINDGQAGSRPGRNAIDVVIKKEMKYLCSRLSKTGLATMDNDAKSCYDRIICTLAMIISQYFGLSAKTTSMQAKTLKRMKFRLRTALGDSKDSYQHSDQTPIHGTGQGSCASPALWLLISSILMDCISDLGGGMTMSDVTKDNIVQHWIDGFVDDTSLFVNLTEGIDKNDVKALQIQLRKDMILWQELLEASGGMLELSKCFYYIMTWKFDTEGAATPVMKIEQQQICSQISIYNASLNSNTNIVQKEVSASHKTLGCFKSVDGNERDQVKYLKQKSDKYGQKIQSAKLNRKQALMTYKMVFIPSIKYSLPACSLTGAEIDQIQKFAVDKFTSAIGYQHTIPRAILFGPQDYGGIELPHLYSEMMSNKLETMISHIRADTQLGKAIMINLNYLQLTAGTEEPLFQSKQNINYIESNWLLHLRDYMIQINAQFQLQNAWKIQKQRTNDIVLMDAFIARGLTRKELKLVNCWRIFFQVNTLVDISEPMGTKIQKVFLRPPKGQIIHKDHQSTLRWPVQQEPGKKGFAVWIKCLKECFNMQNNGCFTHHLGKWIPQQYHLQNTSRAYYQPSTQFGILRTDSKFLYYKPKCTRSASISCNRNLSTSINSIPDDCIPAEYSCKNNIITFRFSKMALDASNTRQNFNQCVEPNDFRTAMLENVVILNEDYIQQKLCDTIHIISDGGIHDLKGTYGVMISDGEYPLVTNKGKLYSVDYLESSFRSEMYGILSGIITYQAILQDKIQNIGSQSNQTKIWIYSDNKAVIKKLESRRNQRRTVNQYRESDVDIEMQVLAEIDKLEICNHLIRIKYVKGHQDSQKAKKQLTHVESMNIWADQLAKEARLLPDQAEYVSFPTNRVNLILNNETINSKYSIVTKKAYHSIELRQYLQQHHKWSNATIESIWWKVYYKSIEKFHMPDKIRIQKFIHDKMSTNKRDHMEHAHKSPLCIQCDDGVIEDEDHIILCSSATCKSLRIEWIKDMTEFLSQKHTPEHVKNAMIIGLNGWFENNSNDIEQEDDRVTIAFEQQNKIGWRNFVRGRMSMEWGRCIQEHLENIQINITSDQWGANLLAIHWKYVLKLWSTCNGKVHGSTPQEQENMTKQNTIEDILHIFRTNDTNIYHSIRIYDEDEFQTMTSVQLMTYLYSLKIVTKMYNQKHKKGSTKDIASYFRTDNVMDKGMNAIHEEADNRSELDPGE